jgi:hypothetical protein
MPRISFGLPSMMSEWAESDLVSVYKSCLLTFRTNICELNTPRGDELKGLVHVLCLLHSHSRVLIVSTQGNVP